jgi:hypothetical protein
MNTKKKKTAGGKRLESRHGTRIPGINPRRNCLY